MRSALTAAARTLLWIVAPLAAGMLILVFAGGVVSPLLYRISSPLYEDSAAPVIGLEAADAIVAASAVCIAVALFLVGCLAVRLPLARSYAVALVGLVAIVGWIIAVEGIDWPLLGGVFGGVVGGAVVMGTHRLIRRRSIASASA